MSGSSQSVCPQAGNPSAHHRDVRPMSKRHQMTLSDYAVMAVCPSLIVLLLSSLVYFLILCAYQGAYSGRIGYIWFMFILGAVNIARLSIEESRKYTLVYSAALGLATFFVLSRFQSISGSAAAFAPFVNAFLIGIVWLLADRITYDCTLIDDDDDASGQGLLDGLSRPRDEPADASERLANPPASRQEVPLGDGNTRSSELPNAAHSRKRKRRPPQPGRTVLWLTAAALPLFGLGQAALRSDPAAISSASRALAVYLFATLSLLVATSFLGVRRYLRQRGVAMPRDVSTAWLGGGIALVALILGVSFLLPQPGKLLADLKLPSSIESPDWLTPSRLGWGSETAQPSGPAAGASPSQAPADASPKSNPGDGSAGQTQTASQSTGQGTSQSGQAGQADAASDPDKSGTAGQPQQPGGSDQSSESAQLGQPKPPAPSGQPSTPSPNQDSTPSGEANQSGQASPSGPPTQQGEPQPADPSAGDSQSASSSNESPPNPQGGEPSSTGRERAESAESERRPESESSADQAASESADSAPAEPNASPPPQSAPPSLNLPSLSGLIKALIYLVLLAIVAAFLWIHRAALTDFWRRLQAWLAGKAPPPSAVAAAAEPAAPPLIQRPFASFANPLVAGADPRRAVIETFQAAEAWFGEHGQPRKRDETPHEYARRLQTPNSSDRQAVEHVTAAYNRVVYGGERPSRQDLQHVQQLWQSVFRAR